MANLIPSEEDVALAVKAKLEADSGFSSAIPGGVFYNIRPSGKTHPYVMLTVESGSREDVETCWDGSAHYASFAQRFTVTASAWVKSVLGNQTPTDSAAVRQFLDASLGGGPADVTGGLTVANSVGVIQAIRRVGALRLNPLSGSQDLLLTAVVLEILVEGRQE